MPPTEPKGSKDMLRFHKTGRVPLGGWLPWFRSLLNSYRAYGAWGMGYAHGIGATVAMLVATRKKDRRTLQIALQRMASADARFYHWFFAWALLLSGCADASPVPIAAHVRAAVPASLFELKERTVSRARLGDAMFPPKPFKVHAEAFRFYLLTGYYETSRDPDAAEPLVACAETIAAESKRYREHFRALQLLYSDVRDAVPPADDANFDDEEWVVEALTESSH